MTAEQVRSAIAEADPKLLEFADLLREKFNARMIYLNTPTLQLGSRKVLREAVPAS